jgi:hypothetical protein
VALPLSSLWQGAVINQSLTDKCQEVVPTADQSGDGF